MSRFLCVVHGNDAVPMSSELAQHFRAHGLPVAGSRAYIIKIIVSNRECMFFAECPDGKYGPSCVNVCGNCAPGTTCDKASGFCPGLCNRGWRGETCSKYTRNSKGVNPANTRHSPNAVSMLVQRRRRWANIETALGECPVFAGNVTGTLAILR